ncbi:unnamed protein product [Urochloa humidicola]
MEPAGRCSGRWAPEPWRGSRRGLAAGSPVRSEARERPPELRRGCRHGQLSMDEYRRRRISCGTAPRVRCSRDARRIGSGGIGAREQRCDEHRTRPHGPPGWKRRGKKSAAAAQRLLSSPPSSVPDSGPSSSRRGSPLPRVPCLPARGPRRSRTRSFVVARRTLTAARRPLTRRAGVACSRPSAAPGGSRAERRIWI